MEELIERETELLDLLQKFVNINLQFIIVGGYAVSSYKHRFSVDADIVIKEESLSKFEEILNKNSFKKTIFKDLKKDSSKFIRYEKSKVSVDLLINNLVSRTTDAVFSFDLLLKNSKKQKIIGIEKEINCLIPSKEILIATKIHSGRLTDFRDIAALAKGTNLELIKKLIFIGNFDKVHENLYNLNKTVSNKNFIDSFKGVFIEKKFDIDFEQVKKISELKE